MPSLFLFKVVKIDFYYVILRMRCRWIRRARGGPEITTGLPGNGDFFQLGHGVWHSVRLCSLILHIFHLRCNGHPCCTAAHA